MEQKTDLRILKTNRAIRETFLSLMYEHGFESITVKQILDGALINRSTFYAHYRDKYDLRDQIEEDLLDGFAACASRSFEGNCILNTPSEASIKTYLSAMLGYLDENRTLVSYLLGPNGDPAFSSKIGNKTHEVWRELGLLPHLNLPENYAFAGLSGMVSGILSEWARSGFHDPKADVIHVLFTPLMNLSQALMVYPQE